MGKFELTISEEKTKIIEFGRCACTKAKLYGYKCETFDFLGFTHFCDKSRWGNFKLGRKTSRKKFKLKTFHTKLAVTKYSGKYLYKYIQVVCHTHET